MNENKSKESLKISSGQLLIIDQYMLGRDDIMSNVERYGAIKVAVEPDEYRVARSAEHKLITLVAGDDGSDEELVESALHDKDHFEGVGNISIHTRCLVLHDASLLEDKKVLKEYRELRSNREEKAARDFLREQGAIIRYGFERNGDDLGVFKNPHHNQLALWPVAIN